MCFFTSDAYGFKRTYIMAKLFKPTDDTIHSSYSIYKDAEFGNMKYRMCRKYEVF